MSTLKLGTDSVSGCLRVLIVEDNHAASKALARILTAAGYTVAVAADGRSAAEALDVGPPPDFILTDLRLPDLDGREVARMADVLNPRPRVGVITGWDLDSEDPEWSAWGIEWVFKKPVNIPELIACLRSPAAVRPARPEAPHDRRRRSHSSAVDSRVERK